MPYRHAYKWVLLLFPAVGLAFWPGYFSQLGTVPWILHAHGITSALWVGLIALQAWSIHREARQIHRSAGRFSLLLFPLFWTSGLLIVQLMGAGFVARDNPFHTIFGAQLAPVDLIASLAILHLYYVALSRRRSVLVHAAAMLSIPLFLMPPILGRVIQIGGPFAIHGPDEFYKFGYGLEASFLLAALIALWAWSRRPRTAWPFLASAMAMVAQTLAFETLGRSAMWEALMAPLASVPVVVVAASGLLLSGAVVWLGWTRGQARPTASIAATTTAPAAG